MRNNKLKGDQWKNDDKDFLLMYLSLIDNLEIFQAADF